MARPVKQKTFTTYNEFCQEVAKLEKGRTQVNIAQIKEVLKWTRILLNRCGVDIYHVVSSTPKEVFNRSY